MSASVLTLKFYNDKEKGRDREIGPFPFGVVFSGSEIRDPLDSTMVAYLDRRSNRWMLASRYEDYTPYIMAILPGEAAIESEDEARVA